MGIFYDACKPVSRLKKDDLDRYRLYEFSLLQMEAELQNNKRLQ